MKMTNASLIKLKYTQYLHKKKKNYTKYIYIYY